MAAIVVLLLVGIILFSLNIISLPSQGSNANVTQTPITTSPLNSTLTYAGVDITVLTAQKSDNFADDPNTKTDGMLRLNIQEQNNLKETVSFLYSQSAHLVLPDGKVISPTYAKAKGGVAPGVTQKSFVDFAVPSSTKLSQLTFRFGTDHEAQMDLPLSGNGQASLAKYQPKSGKLNGVAAAYLQQGLTYSVTGVTSSYSIPGKQADKGMHFLALDISVDNTLAQTAIPGSPFDYMRLKSTNGLNAPVTTTLPISFAQGRHGTTGTVVFQAPLDSTTATLVLLAQPAEGMDPSQVTFQLP